MLFQHPNDQGELIDHESTPARDDFVLTDTVRNKPPNAGIMQESCDIHNNVFLKM